MNELTIGLLGALLATNQPLAVSNVIQQQTGLAVPVAADSETRELRDAMLADDAAQDEVNSWLRAYDAQSATNQTAAASADLTRRIRTRFDEVRECYNRFLKNHPNNARGFLAYGSFLNDIGDEEGAHLQYENSKQLDPKNPAVWNNLANYYGEYGQLTKAFEYYTEAIKLKPDEPVYYQNFATTVYLYRKDAREFYHIDEQQVFDKALGLYQQALKLTPSNFTLATDYAESYYGIKPLRTNDALVAWTNALSIARTEGERQGVQLHLARVKIAAGLYEQVSNHLATVTNGAYAELKQRLYRSLVDHQFPPTNSPAPSETSLLDKIPQLEIRHDSGATNATDLSSNLLSAPIPLRGQKP